MDLDERPAGLADLAFLASEEPVLQHDLRADGESRIGRCLRRHLGAAAGGAPRSAGPLQPRAAPGSRTIVSTRSGATPVIAISPGAAALLAATAGTAWIVPASVETALRRFAAVTRGISIVATATRVGARLRRSCRWPTGRRLRCGTVVATTTRWRPVPR